MDSLIVIVEDDILIAEHLKTILINDGYTNVFTENSFESAIDFISSKKPDLILLDVNLNGDKTGIDVAHFAIQNNINFIYITAQSEKPIVEKIIATKPLAYILKPFNSVVVSTTIKIALEKIKSKSITIKDGIKTEYKINYDEILYIKSEKNYLQIVTKTKSILARNTLKNIKNNLPSDVFIQPNRSCYVNSNYIEKQDNHSLIVAGTEILFSK
ncbi:MAG: DNA-binding response regulator [Bacteroidota bacterium]